MNMSSSRSGLRASLRACLLPPQHFRGPVFSRPFPHPALFRVVCHDAAQELCNMMIECCSQERTWLPYYGLIAQRFCMMHRRWQGAFSECFETNYNTIHR